MTSEQDDLRALLRASGDHGMEWVISRAREIVDSLDHVTLNIAVTGETGAGKSSFVNAIRGVQDTDEGAAPIGEVETTMEPTMYPHPNMPNVKIWDLPGIGSPTFSASTYTRKVDFRKYDFFIILCATRFKENYIMLAKEIKKKKKNFYCVRTKIDQDVDSAQRRGVQEEQKLQEIRDNCVSSLAKLDSPPVFLISSFNLEKFEFHELQNKLEEDLPAHKRDALVLSLPVYSSQSLEKKYNTLKKAAVALAALSGAVAAAPVPGLSTTCDFAMIASFLTKCYFSFGLDDKSLQKMSKRVNKPILKMVKESKLVQSIAEKTLTSKSMVTKLGVVGFSETLSIFLPGIGTVAASGVSAATTWSVLLKGLNELYKLAKEVINMAGLE